MPPKSCRVRLVAGDRQVEVEGERAFVELILKRYWRAKVSTPLPSSSESDALVADSVATEPTGKPTSVREFVQRLAFKRQTDITLAFGYFLEKYSERPHFTSKDINQCYYEAKMESSNTSQMIAQNVKKGFMMAAKGGPKAKSLAFTLTQTGEKHVEARLKAKQ